MEILQRRREEPRGILGISSTYLLELPSHPLELEAARNPYLPLTLKQLPLACQCRMACVESHWTSLPVTTIGVCCLRLHLRRRLFMPVESAPTSYVQRFAALSCDGRSNTADLGLNLCERCRATLSVSHRFRSAAAVCNGRCVINPSTPVSPDSHVLPAPRWEMQRFGKGNLTIPTRVLADARETVGPGLPDLKACLCY